jgi:hypothetical protein
MRLHKTLLTTVTVLAVTGTAFAATTRDEVNTHMDGTSRLAAGGKLQLVVTRKSGKNSLAVTIHYDVTVRSHTVLGFAVYPCKSSSCSGASTGPITLDPGLRHVTFNGHVSLVKRADGSSCVYAQLRDQGPKGKKPGKIVHRGKSKGVTFCRKFSR